MVCYFWYFVGNFNFSKSISVGNMKTMKIFFVFLLSILLLTINGMSQSNQNSKIWVGIWDYKLIYQGAYRVGSRPFDKKWNVLYETKVQSLQEIINSKSIWHYVLIANDSMEIIKTDSLMQLIGITDYEYKWRFDGNSYMSYLRDREEPPNFEFLPDGHWLYFSTEPDKVGVAVEKKLKNNQIEKFCKSYDLERKLVIEYYEVENGLLDGIVYFDMGRKRIKAINRYKDGVFVENLYNRND